MKKNTDTIAIYSRKSKFTGKGESIGNQIELCKEYIRAHYGDDALDHLVVYEDEGFSGGNLNRPDFKKMMAAAKERKFKAIIVYRLDRISRNISDFSSLIEELARLDIAFVSIKEQFDTGSPMGRAMMYIASVFSQLERETIAERIRDNMHELAKTGRWLGGTTPTGFESEGDEKVTVDGKKKKTFKLKLVPQEAEIVRMIYDLFSKTNSLTMTEAELMKRRLVTRNQPGVLTHSNNPFVDRIVLGGFPLLLIRPVVGHDTMLAVKFRPVREQVCFFLRQIVIGFLVCNHIDRVLQNSFDGKPGEVIPVPGDNPPLHQLRFRHGQ